MTRDPDVSVVVCTYNRGEMLRDALASLANQDSGDVNFEVIVVDNNSTDGTRGIVEDFARRDARWHYAFEPRQGLSYARNTGVGLASAPIIAFTDDDVRAATDWVREIKATLDEHPEVEFVGGKVYPRWGCEPPRWLTKPHWMPLAVVDHGDVPLYVDTDRPWCMVGANLSIRKQIFVDAGGFSPEFQRVKDIVGSTEDHEFQLRLWKAGRRGLYAPNIVVEAEIQPNRLTKAYHRRWHAGHGRFSAMMGTETVTDDMPELFGVPACFIRDIVGHARSWSRSRMADDDGVAFLHETKVRFLVSYLRAYRRLQPESRRGGVLRRTAAGFRELARRKLVGQ